MSNERSTVVTYAGLNLLAKGNTGVPILFTKVLLGDGRVSAEQDIRQLTSMINPLLNLPIQDISVTGVGTTAIDANINNKTLVQGFFAREVGVFACEGVVKDNEIVPAGDEILYAYRNTGDKSDYVAAGGGPEVLDLIYNVTTVIDQADKITAVIDGSAAYVNKLDFIKHKESDNPHPNLVKKGEEVSTADTLVCGLSANNRELNYIGVEKLKKQMFGDVANMDKISNRVAQNEANISNIILKLEAEGLMPDCNMLMVELFENPQHTDSFCVQVLSAHADDDSIDVATNSGILYGAYYWITDGINAEQVCVAGVAKNGSVYRVIADKPIKHTYDLTSCYLYRSTVNISNGKVYGSGAKSTLSYRPAVSWHGLNGDTQNTEELKTSESNKGDFTLEGECAFTINGKFTILEG